MTDDWVPPARSPKDVPDEHPPPTLAEFLLARLAETEQVAREAVQRHWYASDNFVDDVDGGSIARFEIKADARHAARHDPARVLAEVAAHRRIVELHGEAPISGGHCVECMGALPCTTLRLLALPHAAHEDYRSEWAP